jgi:hypothetical protein
MRGKRWRKTTLMPRSKQTNKVVVVVVVVVISLTQIYVVIEN